MASWLKHPEFYYSLAQLGQAFSAGDPYSWQNQLARSSAAAMQQEAYRKEKKKQQKKAKKQKRAQTIGAIGSAVGGALGAMTGLPFAAAAGSAIGGTIGGKVGGGSEVSFGDAFMDFGLPGAVGSAVAEGSQMLKGTETQDQKGQTETQNQAGQTETQAQAGQPAAPEAQNLKQKAMSVGKRVLQDPNVLATLQYIASQPRFNVPESNYSPILTPEQMDSLDAQKYARAENEYARAQQARQFALQQQMAERQFALEEDRFGLEKGRVGLEGERVGLEGRRVDQGDERLSLEDRRLKLEEAGFTEPIIYETEVGGVPQRVYGLYNPRQPDRGVQQLGVVSMPRDPLIASPGQVGIDRMTGEQTFTIPYDLQTDPFRNFGVVTPGVGQSEYTELSPAKEQPPAVASPAQIGEYELRLNDQIKNDINNHVLNLILASGEVPPDDPALVNQALAERLATPEGQRYQNLLARKLGQAYTADIGVGIRQPLTPEEEAELFELERVLFSPAPKKDVTSTPGKVVYYNPDKRTFEER